MSEAVFEERAHPLPGPDYSPRRFTVRLRRGDGFAVKPEAEVIDGGTFTFSYGWVIGRDDSSIYVGETAFIPRDPTWPPTAPCWIASGDLIEA